MKPIELIGNTPMIQIGDSNVYVKLEGFNPGGSVKDRAVYWMLKRAMERGEVTRDSVLIEATSGNTGIALAMLGAQLEAQGDHRHAGKHERGDALHDPGIWR